MAGRGSKSTTGIVGVSKNYKSSTYRAVFGRHYIGSFATIEEAAHAYAAFAKKKTAEEEAKREYERYFK